MSDEKDEAPDTEAEQKDTAADSGHEGGDDDRLTRVENAVERIRQMIAGKSGNASRSSRSGDPEAIADQVVAGVEKLRQAEDAKRRSAGTAARLAELETKVKQIAEKAPVELRKVTRYMWGDPDEEK